MLNIPTPKPETLNPQVHVAIEARAGAAVASLPAMQAAAAAGDDAALEAGLRAVAHALQGMQAILARMEERCDPYIYYQRVRWPMAGWRNSAALPEGLVRCRCRAVAVALAHSRCAAQRRGLAALHSAAGWPLDR